MSSFTTGQIKINKDRGHMRVLIIDNDIYLVQSIASKLIEKGFETTIYNSEIEYKSSNFDIVLLDTKLTNFTSLIKRYKKNIIILLNSYNNNDTVKTPLQNGANGYILKPLKVEELIMKIDHHIEYNRLQNKVVSYENYTDMIFEDLDYIDTASMPIVLISPISKLSDFYIIKLMMDESIKFNIIDLKDEEIQINAIKLQGYLYLKNFQELKKQEKVAILEKFKSYNVIISTSFIDSEMEKFEKNYKIIDLNFDDQNIIPTNIIIPIEDYVKQMILSFQGQFPDTELSKKLGISRKSLWEKRKKYGIQKRK